MRDPFERIMNGDKVIEYRDNTPYWTKRLKDKDIKYIYFQYYYYKSSHLYFLIKIYVLNYHYLI